jgi:hypothetical protein
MISMGGEEFDFESALDTVIRALQQHLNDIQSNLRQMTQLADRGESFETECDMSARIEDSLLDMNRLFLDLLDMSDQLVSIPQDPEDKAYWKKFKIERKAIKKQKLKEFDDAKKAEKNERKSNVSRSKPMDTLAE